MRSLSVAILALDFGPLLSGLFVWLTKSVGHPVQSFMASRSRSRVRPPRTGVFERSRRSLRCARDAARDARDAARDARDAARDESEIDRLKAFLISKIDVLKIRVNNLETNRFTSLANLRERVNSLETKNKSLAAENKSLRDSNEGLKARVQQLETDAFDRAQEFNSRITKVELYIEQLTRRPYTPSPHRKAYERAEGLRPHHKALPKPKGKGR